MLEETTSLLMTQLMILLVLRLLKVGFVLEKVNVLIRYLLEPWSWYSQHVDIMLYYLTNLF